MCRGGRHIARAKGLCGEERFLVNRATRFLGRISYSLYLSHPLLIYASGLPPLVAVWVGTPVLTAPLVILAVTLLAVPLAWALYTVVEAPFIATGRFLTANRAEHKATKSGAA